MSYRIVYSEKARQDVRSIYEHIAYELLAKENAENQVKRIIDIIRTLEYMPMRHRLYEEEPWHSQGMRFLPIDNYLVFYLPDEALNSVYIIRIMYAGRNIHEQLENDKE